MSTLLESPSHPQVADMVTRLSTGDWFTAKVSACGLFTAAYKHIEEHDQRTLLRAQVCHSLFVPAGGRSCYDKREAGHFVVACLGSSPFAESCLEDGDGKVLRMVRGQRTS